MAEFEYRGVSLRLSDEPVKVRVGDAIELHNVVFWLDVTNKNAYCETVWGDEQKDLDQACDRLLEQRKAVIN